MDQVVHQQCDATPAGPGSVFHNRPAQKILGYLSNKWNVLVIRRLSKRTMRYAELKRDIGDISEKMLTQTLRQLESIGLVERKIYPVIPPKVEYSLTDLGRTLEKPLAILCDWSVTHIAEVEDALKRYEEKKKAEQ